MSRPRTDTEQVNLRLPRPMLKRAVALAIEDGRSRSEIMREAFMRGLRILEAEAVARKPAELT